MAAVKDALDPSWINAPGGVGPSYDAEELRRLQGYQLAAGATPGTSRTGLLNPRDLALSLSGSNVLVGAGGAVIGTAKGAYVCGVAATTTIGALLAADVTNPRRDRVVLEILDPDNGGGAGRKAQLRIIDGTPNALAATGGGFPVAPTSPFVDLGYVDVPKSGAGAPSLTVTAPITAAAGAPIPVRSLADRNALATWPGLQVIRLDLPAAPIETHNGTKWSVSDVPWTPLSMVQGFTPVTTSDWPGMRYRVKNGVFTANGAVSRTWAWGADQVFALIPAAYRPGFRVQGANCQYQHTDGNLSFDTAGSTARAAFITWPLE